MSEYLETNLTKEEVLDIQRRDRRISRESRQEPVV
jgi:hypothetical protein